jgi:hypothetical protein
MYNRNPTAQLWLFAYGGIAAGTHCSILSEMLAWGPNLDHQVARGDALISRTRSKVGTWFLDADRKAAGDVCLMVDHDLSWQPEDLSLIARRALEHNAIVAGIYSKRTFGAGPAIVTDDTGDFTIGEDRLIRCQYVSSGFMAVPRSVFAAVAQTMERTNGETPNGNFYPFFLPMLHNGEYLSEDWAFCERARACGFQVLASTGPRLVHEGDYGYRVVDAISTPPPAQDITIRAREVAHVR